MHTQNPVCAGVPFDQLNPRMDQQQVPPVESAIPIYVVDGRPMCSDGEAQRAAEALAKLWEKPTDIFVGNLPLDGLKPLRTVPAPPSISSATFTNAAVDARFEGTTTQPGANQEVVSRLPEMTTADIVHGTSTKVKVPKPKPAWHALPICGLVTINNLDWEPKSRLDVPPSPTMNLGMDIAAQFAIAYNQSDFARMKRRWCVVTNRGTCLILTAIPADQRPLNPCDFPPIVQQGLTFPEAEKAADEQNTERHRLARIPRNWTVSLRRADSVQRNDA